jgi:hypothetical protein
VTELQQDGQVFGHTLRVDPRAGKGLRDLQRREPCATTVGGTLELLHLSEQLAQQSVQSAQDRMLLLRAAHGGGVSGEPEMSVPSLPRHEGWRYATMGTPRGFV